MEEWRILPFQKAGAAENMAVDEAVFRESIRKKAPPTLRFYGWRVPALSIGYFQDYEKEVDDEACRRFGVEVVRRPTGGKAVLHEQELTYAVIAGADSPLFPSGYPGNLSRDQRLYRRRAGRSRHPGGDEGGREAGAGRDAPFFVLFLPFPLRAPRRRTEDLRIRADEVPRRLPAARVAAHGV